MGYHIEYSLVDALIESADIAIAAEAVAAASPAGKIQAALSSEYSSPAEAARMLKVLAGKYGAPSVDEAIRKVGAGDNITSPNMRMVLARVFVP